MALIVGERQAKQSAEPTPEWESSTGYAEMRQLLFVCFTVSMVGVGSALAGGPGLVLLAFVVPLIGGYLTIGFVFARAMQKAMKRSNESATQTRLDPANLPTQVAAIVHDAVVVKGGQRDVEWIAAYSKTESGAAEGHVMIVLLGCLGGRDDVFVFAGVELSDGTPDVMVGFQSYLEEADKLETCGAVVRIDSKREHLLQILGATTPELLVEHDAIDLKRRSVTRAFAVDDFHNPDDLSQSLLRAMFFWGKYATTKRLFLTPNS